MKQSNTYVLSLIRSNNVTSNGDIFILPTMFQIAKLHFFLQIQKTKPRKIYYIYLYHQYTVHTPATDANKKAGEISPAWLIHNVWIYFGRYYLLSKASTAFAFAASTSALAFALAASTSA